MTELDTLLGRFAEEPIPGELAALDGAVLAGLGMRREARTARRALMLAGGVAVLVGMAGTLGSASPASAEPLLGVPEAAPSHLLAD